MLVGIFAKNPQEEILMEQLKTHNFIFFTLRLAKFFVYDIVGLVHNHTVKL